MTDAKKAEMPNTEKPGWKWDKLMREFNETSSRNNECRTFSQIKEVPRTHRDLKQFSTGSTYEGTWDVLGLTGHGTYTFPNGVIYEGDFEDGEFHGEGYLRYPDGTILQGKWDNGLMTDKKLFFADGLQYDEHNWLYCKMPDRRFAVEYERGVQPAGKSYLTAEQPTREVPVGYYDTGDGFFDPVSRIVYQADDITQIVRSPGLLEAQWIVDNCRSANPPAAVGPRPDLYEEWTEPHTNLPEPPPPASAGLFLRRDTDCSDDFYDDEEILDLLRWSRPSIGSHGSCLHLSSSRPGDQYGSPVTASQNHGVLLHAQNGHPCEALPYASSVSGVKFCNRGEPFKWQG